MGVIYELLRSPNRPLAGTRGDPHFPISDFCGKLTSRNFPVGYPVMAQDDDSEFRLERAKKLQRALRNKQWTRIFLAEKTGYDEKTIRNVLSGESVRDHTIIDICEALGIEPIFEEDFDSIDVAKDDYGGYLRSTHRIYETFYNFYRRDTLDERVIYKTIIEVNWDRSERRLSFKEYYRRNAVTPPVVNFHTGPVYISPHTHLLHMLTFFEGSVRLLTLTKLRKFEGIMRGALLTQTETVAFYQPTVSPVVLRALVDYDHEHQLESDIALIPSNLDEYHFANKELLIAERQIVNFALTKAGTVVG
jgi:transcriptional regulator with XRE-family HTH domain